MLEILKYRNEAKTHISYKLPTVIMFQVVFNVSFTLKTGRRTKSHIAVVKRFHNQLAAKVEPWGNLFFQPMRALPQTTSHYKKKEKSRGPPGSVLQKILSVKINA